VAIANALQLEAAWATPALCSFNYDAMPSSVFAKPINCRIMTYFASGTGDLNLWPCDFDLWPLTMHICSLSPVTWRDETLYQIWTQSNNSRRSYCDDSVWPSDLEHVLSVALGSGIIFTKFDLRQLIRSWIIAFFDADTLCYAVTLTFDRLTLKVRGTSSVMWSKSVQNVSEIEQSPAELLIIWRIFWHTLYHAVTLKFDLLTMNF